MPTITKTEKFDSLCIVNIYYHADMCYWEKQGKSDSKKVKAARRKLKQLGVEQDGWRHDYNAYVIEWALNPLPDRYFHTHDYWGAQCFSCLPKWECPRNGFFAGDSSGELMWFESHKALEDYTKIILKRIEEGGDL